MRACRGARCEEDCLERYPNNATELDELRYRFEVKIPNRFYALNAEVALGFSFLFRYHLPFFFSRFSGLSFFSAASLVIFYQDLSRVFFVF